MNGRGTAAGLSTTRPKQGFRSGHRLSWPLTNELDGVCEWKAHLSICYRNALPFGLYQKKQALDEFHPDRSRGKTGLKSCPRYHLPRTPLGPTGPGAFFLGRRYAI